MWTRSFPLFIAHALCTQGFGRISIGLFAWRAANALERPSYTVLQALGDGVELRQYSPYVVAETKIAAPTMKAGSGKGFQTVAGYIFGKNKPRAKMAMTAPVRISAKTGGAQMAMTAPVRTQASDGSTRVSFVLEKAYSRRTAPKPLDGGVRLKDVRPHLLAARKFSGPPPTEARVERERERILAALDANGLSPDACVTRGTIEHALAYTRPYIHTIHRADRSSRPPSRARIAGAWTRTSMATTIPSSRPTG